LNRYNFYFKQLVGESDLDGAFDKAEAADHAIITDQGVFGIMSGLNVAEVGVPNLTVDVSIGRGYDQQGRRILNPATQNVDLSSVLPLGGGNLKWVSVAIRFARFESDPRVDGNNVNIFYNLAESFELFLVEGAESAGPPARPGKPGNGLVLADILLVQGMTEVTNGDIDQATDGRRDWAFELLATTPAQVKAGTITEVAQEVLNELNNHINGAANEHPATAISTSPSAPALARGLTASDVQTNLDELATAFAALGFSNTFTGPNTFDQDVDINAILTVTDSLIATMDFDLGTNDTHFGSLLANVTMGDSAAYAHVFNGDVTLGFDATNLVTSNCDVDIGANQLTAAGGTVLASTVQGGVVEPGAIGWATGVPSSTNGRAVYNGRRVSIGDGTNTRVVSHPVTRYVIFDDTNAGVEDIAGATISMDIDDDEWVVFDIRAIQSINAGGRDCEILLAATNGVDNVPILNAGDPDQAFLQLPTSITANDRRPTGFCVRWKPTNDVGAPNNTSWTIRARHGVSGASTLVTSNVHFLAAYD
jgi:hypothetical protein